MEDLNYFYEKQVSENKVFLYSLAVRIIFLFTILTVVYINIIEHTSLLSLGWWYSLFILGYIWTSYFLYKLYNLLDKNISLQWLKNNNQNAKLGYIFFSLALVIFYIWIVPLGRLLSTIINSATNDLIFAMLILLTTLIVSNGYIYCSKRDANWILFSLSILFYCFGLCCICLLPFLGGLR